MAKKKPTEPEMPAPSPQIPTGTPTVTPTAAAPLDAGLLRQALHDARVPSDVTMGLFGHLQKVQACYAALLAERANRIHRAATGAQEDDTTV